MTIPQSLLDLLKNSHTDFEVLEHERCHSAQEMAQAVHIPGRDVAKPVLIRDGDDLHLVVVAAERRVDLDRLGESLHLKNPRLATEQELAGLFPDCEVGAMPIFGNLYGMRVAVDSNLVPEDKIAFPAGTHEQAIRLATADFMRLAEPTIVEVGEHL